MSRAATGDVVHVKPGLNIYTVLVIAAVIVQVIGLAVVFMRAHTLGVKFF
jgi:hypothetical protein